MRLLFPISFLIQSYSVFSDPMLIGAEKCTWGPTYWCNSIAESHECAALQFCTKKSWNKPLRLKDQLCDLCMSVADKAIDTFKDNEDQLKETLLNMCNYVTVVDKCQDMINEYWEQIKDMINDDLDSQILCSAMNMCQQIDEQNNDFQFILATGFTGPLLMPEIHIENDSQYHIKFDTNKASSNTINSFNYHSSSKSCNDCVQFGVDIKSNAESSDKLNILVNTIQEVCDQLEMRSICRLVLNKKVIKRIIDKVDIIDICHQVDICNENDNPILPNGKGDSCHDCNNMLQDMQNMAENDFNKFENVIESACDLIPKPVNEMCKKLSRKLAQEAANSLKDANIDECCQDLSLCDNNDILDDKIRFNPSNNNLQINNKYCDYCEMAVEYIQYALDSDMTTDQIKQGLESLCLQLVNGKLVATCQQFIEKYWNQIVDDMDMILDNPEQVCVNMHLCKPGSNVEGVKFGSYGFPDECTFGPVYWCKSEENRKKCGCDDDCAKRFCEDSSNVHVPRT